MLSRQSREALEGLALLPVLVAGWLIWDLLLTMLLHWFVAGLVVVGV